MNPMTAPAIVAVTQILTEPPRELSGSAGIWAS